jgi:putative ABC transport system permease protein
MRIYRLLQRLLPPSFRARFGDDMAEVYADRRRAARRRGLVARTSLVWHTSTDVVTTAWAERRRTQQDPNTRRHVMRHLIDDCIAATRAHVRRPAFAAAAIVMLALGLGFNSALFGVVKSVLLTPLPFVEPDRLVLVWTGRNPDGSGGVSSYADLLDWRGRTQSFEALATFNISLMTLVTDHDAEEIHGSTVSPEFFRVLRTRFVMGRGIEAGDETVDFDKGRPIVLSYNLWMRRFGGDPAILEHTITLGERKRRVVGITSQEFTHPEPMWDADAQYWVPMTVSDDMATRRANRYLRVIGRLKPGVSLKQAQAEMDGIGRSLMRQYPVTNTASAVVDRLQDDLVGDTSSLALLFLGASTLVLCLAMANIINLLLARVSRRQQEFAIRSALGASRARLMTQVVVESTTVALVGGFVGLGLARLVIQAITAVAPSNVVGLGRAGIDGSVVAFTALLSVMTGVLCGVVPAWRVARASASRPIAGARTSSGLDVSRARTWLIAVELALALPLLVGTALLTESLRHLQQVDLGFDPSHAIQFRVSLVGDRYAKEEALVAFFDELTQRLAAEPGVRSAGAVSSLPLGGLNNTGSDITYHRTDGALAEISVGFRSTTAGYFDAMRIPLRRGRLFSFAPADVHTVVVNDQAAREMFGDADPLGREIRFGRADDPKPGPWLTVIGVVGSIHHETVARPTNPEIFQPYQANTWSTMTVVAGTTGDPTAIGPDVQRIMRAIDPRVAIVNLAPASTFVDGQLQRPRFGAAAAAVLGGVGLVLAAFGMFAVLSLLVGQRTREIGIRMALGSTSNRVLRMLVREAAAPVGAGCVVGCLGAMALGRALGSQLFGVTASDPTAFLLAMIVLIVTTGIAIWRPAVRAMSVDPITALRDS